VHAKYSSKRSPVYRSVVSLFCYKFFDLVIEPFVIEYFVDVEGV